MSIIKETLELANGIRIPKIGYGTWQLFEGEHEKEIFKTAIRKGYRLIDTAAMYDNEVSVGRAIKESKVPRDELFVTSKLMFDVKTYDGALEAFESTMRQLDLDYLDLYLVHWPVKGKYKDTWKALETLYDEGRIRAIGVSNFMQHHLEDLMDSAKVFPMVNQIEFHPYLRQQDLLDFCKNNNIQFEAWSPLMQGKIFGIDLLKELAEKYDKTIAQVVLRWDLQKEVVTIPKSVKKERIESNADIFDFEISDEDMARIDDLDRNERIGPHPDSM
ncbi:MAG: aldo/keto reductase [Marinilabilia sp.]